MFNYFLYQSIAWIIFLTAESASSKTWFHKGNVTCLGLVLLKEWFSKLMCWSVSANKTIQWWDQSSFHSCLSCLEAIGLSKQYGHHGNMPSYSISPLSLPKRRLLQVHPGWPLPLAYRLYEDHTASHLPFWADFQDCPLEVSHPTATELLILL